MAPAPVVRMQSVPTLMEASLAHAYQATVEMERVAGVRNLTDQTFAHMQSLITSHTNIGECFVAQLVE